MILGRCNCLDILLEIPEKEQFQRQPVKTNYSIGMIVSFKSVKIVTREVTRTRTPYNVIAYKMENVFGEE